MDMDQAAVWLAGSILVMLGFIVVMIGIIIINNLIHKYWKPIQLVNWFNPPTTTRFMTEEEYAKQNEPTLNPTTKK